MSVSKPHLSPQELQRLRLTANQRITGVITIRKRRRRDFVGPGTVGIGYVSPGYKSEAKDD